MVRLTIFLTFLTIISSCNKLKFNDLDNTCLFYFDKMVIICKTYHMDSIESMGFHRDEEWKIIKVESLDDLKILDKRITIDPVVFQTKTKPDLKRALRLNKENIKKSLNLESKYDYKIKAEEIYNLK